MSTLASEYEEQETARPSRRMVTFLIKAREYLFYLGLGLGFLGIWAVIIFALIKIF